MKKIPITRLTAYAIATAKLGNERLANDISIATREYLIVREANARVWRAAEAYGVCLAIESLGVQDINRVHVRYDYDRGKYDINIGDKT